MQGPTRKGSCTQSTHRNILENGYLFCNSCNGSSSQFELRVVVHRRALKIVDLFEPWKETTKIYKHGSTKLVKTSTPFVIPLLLTLVIFDRYLTLTRTVMCLKRIGINLPSECLRKQFGPILHEFPFYPSCTYAFAKKMLSFLEELEPQRPFFW